MNDNEAKGHVIWITGLSGAGKTTIGTGVYNVLKSLNIPVVLLDGDELRSILANKWGYTPGERKELAHVYSRFCKLLTESGVHVICSTISMFHEVRHWNRLNIPNYFEIFLRVPVEVLKERDTKGLYEKFTTQDESESVLSDAFELPVNSDIIIDNYGENSPDYSIWEVSQTFLQKLVFGQPISIEEDRRHALKSGITNYWDNYYMEIKAPMHPTDFARYCLEKHIKPEMKIVEFGCGNGRDSFYFAEHNDIIAIDVSSTVIKRNIEISNDKKIKNDIKFYTGRFGETRLPVTGLVDIVYSRFTMHAMDEDSENLALQESYKLLKLSGLLLLEFRTIKDPLYKEGVLVGKHEKFTDHYRRFIDTNVFNNKLVNLGFEIDYFIEAKNLAKFHGEDPIVARIVARKAN